MGYTHYYTQVESSRDDALLFEMFSLGVVRIIENAIREGYKIADGHGKKLNGWIADNFVVSFNGYGKDSHETFYMASGDQGFNFCKTAGKPYDAVVTACLIHMKDVYRDLVEITSDGFWVDWRDGAKLYRNATGLTADNPLKERVEV
jgi:hypothetical protein